VTGSCKCDDELSGSGATELVISLCIQTGSGAHPASYLMGTGCSFPGGKERPERDADLLPHLVPRARMSRSYTFSPPKRLHSVYLNSFSFFIEK
jgi:hypothetical protein